MSNIKSDNRFIKSVFNKHAGLSFAALLCSTLGQLGNSIIVGNILGDTALSAVTLISPLYCVYTIGGYLLGIGGSAVCSFLIGKSSFDEGKKAYTVTYLLFLITAALLTVFLLVFLPQILDIIGVTADLYDEVYPYALLTVICGVFTMAMYLAFNFLRLDGKLGASMLIFLIQAVVTIALDILLLNMGLGLKGVGIATLCGTGIAGVGGFLIICIKGKNVKPMAVNMKEFFSLSRKIITTGSPGAVENSCIAIRSVLMNNMLIAAFGTFAVTALGVVNSVNTFALIIIAAFSGTIVPFIGVFSAERDTGSIKKVLKLALTGGAVMTVVFAIFTAFFPSTVALVFGITKGSESYVQVISAISIFSFSLLGSLVNNILIMLHLSSGRVWLANVMTFLRHFGFIVLFAFVLKSVFGVDGVWHAFWVTELATLVVATVLHLILSAKKPNMNKWTLLDEEMEKRGKAVSYTIENSVESVMNCVENVTAFCDENELSPKRAMLVSLSLEEMLNSIREHAFTKDKNLTIDVRIAIMDDIIVIRIRNGGEEFDPISYYKNIAKNVNKNDIDAIIALQDSLGIKMIIEATEVVDYRKTFGINNLTVTIR